MLPIIFRKNYIYTVRHGDTLYSIAQRFNSSTEVIERANHLFDPVTDHGLIFPGDVLVVPNLLETGKVSYVVKSGDTMSSITSRFSTFSDLVAGINNQENHNFISPDQQLIVSAYIYQIQSGDTLSAISHKFGIPLLNISKANQGRPGYQEDVIWPEFHLILPLPTSRNIVVWNPLPGTKVVNGQRIEGLARAFEANVLHQLRDTNGVIVSNERFTTADEGAPEYGNFTSILPFDRTPSSNTGELWVYTRSAKDGSIQDLVKTKVYF
ncbi:peptidoglycan-binding LysM [Bacillus methanolicus]|uniref:LysM peptidoglycan-binding domain-containing protein n=1 Tax=Bacillus methanolicus TaxID=1471 RepID=UPI00237FFB45|nr:LysM peptidoglycan-binding domain-containing protein [Bacillus methanolicus]MDE3839119.1 peptidoglycan-binding LysM [Bacillus methanolicus]